MTDIHACTEDDILPPLKPIKGLRADDIEEVLGQIRADIDAATRKAHLNAPWHRNRCHCPRCMVIR